MRETQHTIKAWQDEKFPTATVDGILKHIDEEYGEFLGACAFEHDNLAALEAADLVILLFAWANKKNIDLMAKVDEKMAINRARTWNIQSDGTGRHT